MFLDAYLLKEEKSLPEIKSRFLIYSSSAVIVLVITIILLTVTLKKYDRYDKSDPEKINISINGSTSVVPLMGLLIENYKPAGSGVIFKLEPTGSKAGIRAVSRGEVELGLSSRNLTPEEQLAGLKSILIAKDTIAIVVHPSNPIEEISLEQVRQIFTGKIDSWQSLTDYSKAVKVISRENVSGTRDAFEEMIGITGMLSPAALVYNGSEGVKKALASQPEGISYLSISFIDKSVKPVFTEGVKPDSLSVVAGRYLLGRPFYILYKEENLHQETRRFIDWILSAEGQSIVVRKWVPVR